MISTLKPGTAGATWSWGLMAVMPATNACHEEASPPVKT